MSQPEPIQRRANVVLFGEMGAGKSSVINLISGLDQDIAKISGLPSPLKSCTWDARPYDVTIQGQDFRIFETVGWDEPFSFRDPDLLIDSINKAYRLIGYLSDTGGIHLLAFCMRRGRITVNMQRNYSLFHDFLCHRKVPAVLLITHLEHEENMEDWWLHNHAYFADRGIYAVGHACITANRQFTDRYQASRQAVQDLLVAHSCEIGFTQERASWVTELFQKSLDFLGFRPQPASLRRRAQRLRECGLRANEITALLMRISAVDEDVALPGDSDRRTTSDEAPDLDHQRRDLTSQITREGPDPVASGAFADIYRGTLQLNAQSIKVAIKAIRTYSHEDGDFTKNVKRLRREVQVWLNLKHDNVLPLLGTTIGFSQFPAMVCPWAENGTLTSYLKHRHVDLTVVEILRLLDNVASGLQYLHSRSVVHGDLSGSNILINEHGRAWIADFGLSVQLRELTGSTSPTSSRMWGTIRWTAPELFDINFSENEVEEAASSISPTTHSDVYSFGSIMLQILSGEIPYHYYPNERQVLLAVSKGIAPKRSSNALVTDDRWSFIQRCWSTVDVTRTRPTCDEIVDFTRNEHACVSAFIVLGDVGLSLFHQYSLF